MAINETSSQPEHTDARRFSMINNVIVRLDANAALVKLFDG